MRRLLLAGVAAAALAPRGAAVAQPQRPGSAAIVGRARLDTTSGIDFHALVAPETVYVGQQATYQVGVFLSDDVRYRLRRNPEFIPPELRAMLSYDLALPGAALARRQAGARGYDTHVFQRALFPLSAGTFEIPPARLNYALPLSASFFSREESHSLSSERLVIVAREPPPLGRPAGYAGAVGQLRIGARLDNARARVGDPLLLTLRVDGSGNVNLFPRPRVDVPWGRTVAASERVELDSTAALLRGAKEFDYVVTPTRSGALEVPAVRYPYFDPYTERYEIAVTAPQSVDVAPGSLTATDPVADADSALRLPVVHAPRASAGTPLFARAGYWLALLLAPLPLAALALAPLVRTRPTPTARAELRRAAAHALTSATDRAGFRRAYSRALVERVGLAPTALADRRALERALRRAGVSRETAAAAERALAELDASVYSLGGEGAPELARRALDAFAAVDAEAVPRPIAPSAPLPRALPALLLATLLPFSVARAQGANADSAFARGVRAYDARRLGEASHWFAEAARRAPRSADAWANLGTAAWERGDSLAAAAAWQRALRLDPTSESVRQRLTMLPGFRDGLLGDVPPVPLDATAVVALLLWFAGWLVLALARARRDVQLRRAGALVAIAGALTLLLGAWSWVRGSPDRLSLLDATARLRAFPALGAEDAGAPRTGQVARTVQAQRAWSRVRLSDGRVGWVETERLLPLAVAAADDAPR